MSNKLKDLFTMFYNRVLCGGKSIAIEPCNVESTAEERTYNRVKLVIEKLRSKELISAQGVLCNLGYKYKFGLAPKRTELTIRYVIQTKLGLRNINIQHVVYDDDTPFCRDNKLGSSAISFLEGSDLLYSIRISVDEGSLRVNIQPNLDGNEPMTESQIYDSFIEIETIVNEALEKTIAINVEKKRLRDELDAKHTQNMIIFKNRF